MKLSLWQQFSSNHSAGFTVVGTFSDAAAANKIADELREFLGDVAQWRYADAKKADFPRSKFSWPELEISQRYNVDWSNMLPNDWYYDNDSHDPNAKHVITIDNHMIVSNIFNETWQGAEPLAVLVKAMGGDIVFDGESQSTLILVTVTFTAPDDKSASQICDETQKLFDELAADHDDETPIPWLVYVGGERHPQADELLATEKIANQIRRYERESYARQHREAGLPSHWKIVASQDEGVPQLDPKVRHHISHMQYYATGRSYAKKPIVRNGTQVRFMDIHFFTLGTGLPALLAWLSALGCENITYTITSKDWSEVKPK